MSGLSGLRSRIVARLRSARSYGGLTTKGPVTEHVMIPRGRIPPPEDNNYLQYGSLALGFFTCGAGLAYHAWKENRVKDTYERFKEEGFPYWKDFENKRMPQHARVLAEGPCGDQFQAAYLCAIFPEEGQNCSSTFEEFASCVSKQPEMMRPLRPDGEYNFESKLVLHRLGQELTNFRNNIDAAGPAEEDLDLILDEYRARYKLGPNASDSEVKNYLDKFHSVSKSFWREVTDLWEGKKTDGSEARRLYKQLNKEYAIPADVWLEVLKEYDVEEFDEEVTRARRKYGYLASEVKRHRFLEKVSDVDLSNVTCGEDFGKLYRCLSERKNESDCADIVDELFFCRQHNTLQVWPYMKSFEQKNPSYTAELARVSEMLHQNPIIE